MDLSNMRIEYETAGLDESDLLQSPIKQFESWFSESVASKLPEPNAAVVATVDAESQPWTRHVLVKKVSERGFEFFTNFQSSKSQQLKQNPKASITFGWLQLHRQVHVAGEVEIVSEEESTSYWNTRSRASQLGSAASTQSQVIEDRNQLLEKVAELDKLHPGPIPKPTWWGGWRIVPFRFEFWQGQTNRMHDRFVYERCAVGWETKRLSP